MPTLVMVEYDYENSHRFYLPIIELRISGAPHYFVVDTGAMETCLSMRLASLYMTERQFRSRKERLMGGIGGHANGFTAYVQCNFIGMVIPFATFINDDVFKRVIPGKTLSGIIGQDILQQFDSVEFDFKAKLIRFKKG